MFCTNCGKNLEDSQASFCPDCGAPISGAPASADRNQLPELFPDHFPETPEASGSARLWVPWRGGQVAWGLLFLIIGFIGTSILMLIAVTILLFTDNWDQILVCLDQVVVCLDQLLVDINQPLFAWGSSVLVGLFILLIVWYLGLRPTRGSVALLGLRPPRIPAGRAILWAIGALALSFAATFLYSVIIEWIGVDWLQTPESYAEIVFEGPAVVLTLLALALWTPLTEELFFRGFVLAGLVHRFGGAGAIVISAMIFSAFHVVPGVLIPIFITGLLLAWLYHHTGSLWPSIAAHAGQNAAALLATIFVPSSQELGAIILPAG